MNPETLQTFNRLVDIANEAEEMLHQLDKYRQTSDKRHLFATRTHENNIRKLIKAEKLAQTQQKAA